jgi:hypothetical protein
MNENLLATLDVFLTVAHIFIIGFNLIGWIFVKTRKLHFWVVMLTLFSWIVLGIWYGWGYCFLTDWHWDIKRSLGESSLPLSFITYLTNNLLGFNFSNAFVNGVLGIVFTLIVLLTVGLQIKNFRRN